jgi:hypothetical protein
MKSVASKSVERSRRPVCGVACRVLPVPPAVIHSPVRTTSQTQMAFLGLAGLLHGLLRHQSRAYGWTFQSFLAPLPLLERELGIYGANSVRIRARRGCRKRRRPCSTVFDIA